MNAFSSRLKEPSTWAGLAALAQVAKVFFPAYGLVFDVLTGCAGSVAVVKPEAGSKNVAGNQS